MKLLNNCLAEGCAIGVACLAVTAEVFSDVPYALAMVGVDWASSMMAGDFLAATNFVVSGSNTVWDDVGDTNRPPPGVATQRFYRLWTSP